MKKNTKLSNIFNVKTMAAAMLLTIPALAATGGGMVSQGGYIGPLPDAWFDGEPCKDEPITHFVGEYVQEYQVDVSAVKNDGDPNTYARCYVIANLQQVVCNVGLGADENGVPQVAGCVDGYGPHALPRDGDILYMNFIKGADDECNIFIGTGNAFGVADPKCRDTSGSGGTSGGTGGSNGTGGTGGTSGLGCDAGNATTVVTNQVTSFTANACYSYNKVQNTLKFGNWSGVTFGLELEDSANNAVSATIGTGGWFDVVGVANGTVYFKVDQNVEAQVDSW